MVMTIVEQIRSSVRENLFDDWVRGYQLSRSFWPELCRIRITWEILNNYPFPEFSEQERYDPGNNDISKLHLQSYPLSGFECSMELLYHMSSGFLNLTTYPGWHSLNYVGNDRIVARVEEFHITRYNKHPLSYYFKDYSDGVKRVEVRWSENPRKDEVEKIFGSSEIVYIQDQTVDLMITCISEITEVFEDGTEKKII